MTKYILVFLFILNISLLIVCCCFFEKNTNTFQNVSYETLKKPTFLIKNESNPKFLKIVVRVFSDFCTSEQASIVFSSMCPNFETFKDTIRFTSGNDYTHCVVLNTPKENLLVPKQYVIGLAHEPFFYLGLTNEFILYAEQNIGKYYIGDTKNLNLPFVQHIPYLWHTPLLNSIYIKTSLMSIIFSNKKETKGQQYRHEIVNQILTSNLPIDVWGRGCENVNSLDSRIKGGFDQNEPYESYQFTIAIENCEHPFYVSEKFINPLMVQTIPLYYGSSCVDIEFPNCFIRLNGNLEHDLGIIKNVLESPSKYSKTINNRQIAEKCDLVQHLHDVFLI